tara:strand:- start:208 stop:2346 length:2139 start_codon:yes stop_codon:yes gene_type:complete
MSLLVRGIKSSGQGLGALDAAIVKAEADKAVFENNMTDFNTLLSGYEADSNYLGKKSKTILTEYANAFENAIDMYSSDPSKENKQKVDELKLITTDFYNKATAARKNSLQQLQAVIQNPQAFEKTLSQAQQDFAAAEDAEVIARFDPTTNQMYISQGQTQGMLLGEDGYYNGENPLYFGGRNKFGEIMAEGSWASTNQETYIPIIGQEAIIDPDGNVVRKSGRDRVIEAFVETGMYDTSPYQETAIYNYINDVKGVKLETLEGEQGMRQLEQMIFEIKQSPQELERALRYYGGLEADYIAGAASRVRDQAEQERFDELFSGQIRTRQGQEPPQQLTGIYQDPYLGAYDVEMFAGEGYNATEMTGLGENEQLRGFNMQSDGTMLVYIDEKIEEVDQDTQQVIPGGTRQVFKVIGPDSDLYQNIENEVAGTGIIADMISESKDNQKTRESRENARIINGYYERDEVERRGGQVDTSGLDADELETATTTQSERQEQAEQELRSSGSVADTEEELTLNRLPQSVREEFYSEEDRNDQGFYDIPERAKFRGSKDVVVDGEVVGERVIVFNPNTGKYETKGMQPPQRSVLSRVIDGIQRFFSSDDTDTDTVFEYTEEAKSEVGSEPAQETTPPEQREPIDAIGPEVRERQQEVARESSETIANLPPEIQDKVAQEIDGERGVFVKLIPNSDNTADIVIFVDSLGEELAKDSILVERA